ncbi:MAG: hypothetical protein OEV47_01005, partial [Gammaproteobacteria bacterium]|nr:hypothetical protein [Gammaproteobacteria bacterium]
TKALIRESGTVAPGSISTPSASEVAAELSNPNSTLGSMSLYFDYLGMQGDLEGADSASATKITFQPSMPYPISKTANFFFRPLFPLIVQQEVPDGDGVENKTFELGDIGYDLAVFNSWRNGLIFGGGMAGAIPTATDNALGADRWTLGPEVILAVMKPWGVLGLIASHQWDVGGGGDDEIEVTGGQYIYSFNIKDGWVFAAGPTFSYNHKADDGNKLTLPLGIGASKTAFLGGRAWKFGLQYWYYVESPDLFGPRHQLRLQVTPVVKLPW